VTGKKLESDDIAQATDLQIHVWDEHQLEYFEAVAEAIGDYAKYEIIHSLKGYSPSSRDPNRAANCQFSGRVVYVFYIA